jgi:hypothetical protein
MLSVQTWTTSMVSIYTTYILTILRYGFYFLFNYNFISCFIQLSRYLVTVVLRFIAKLEKYKSPCSNQIQAELFQAGGEILLSANHKLINSVWNKEELPDQWKESIIIPVHKKGHKTDCNNYRGISLQNYPISFPQG